MLTPPILSPLRARDVVAFVTSDRGWALALLALSVGLLAHGLVAAWPYTTDDAYIIFRYSQNLAAGHGATFNVGQPPVEGCTTFLWMVLMTIPHLLGVAVVPFAKMVGVVFTLGYLAVAGLFAAYLTADLSRERRRLLASMTVALLAAPYWTSIHAVSCMGTPLASLLITAFAFCLTAYMEHASRRLAVLLALTSLLLGLTRPEGTVLVLVGVATAMWLLPRTSRVRLLGSIVVVCFLPWLLYFTWRYAVYGRLFPLPFYVKVLHQHALPGARDVLRYVAFVALHTGVFILLGLSRCHRRLAPALAGVAALTIFFLFPAHYVGFASRYLFPLTPLCFVVAALGFGALLDMVTRNVWAGISALTIAGLLANIRSQEAEFNAYASSMRRAHERLGRRLLAIKQPGSDPVLATGEAGMIPYLSQWRTIDTFGLNDELIATTGSHDPALVLSRHPDLVVVASRNEGAFVPANGLYEEDLLESSLREGMVTVGVLPCIDGSYYLWLLARPDSEIGRQLREWAPSGPAVLKANSAGGWKP